MNSRYLKVASRLVVALTIWIYSCSEPDTSVNTPPVKPDPNDPAVPLPSCSSTFIDGYTGRVSYLPGEAVDLFINGSQPSVLCSLAIYNVDMVAVLSVPITVGKQGIQTSDPSRDGFGYSTSSSFVLPADLSSGVYLIEKTVPFVVRTKDPVDVMVVYPSNTANAYAQSGGKSLYTTPRATTVSFHRPIALEPFCKNCLPWFKALSTLKVGYIADVDLDLYENIKDAKVLAIIGHNEYWTRSARVNFDRFVDEGGDALILSGNTMWWQVRYTDDGTGMICYKSLETDPLTDPLLKTFLWNAAELQYPIIKSIGADFDNGGYGLKSDAGWNGFKIVSPNSPLLQGTQLKMGDIIYCPTVEWDGAPVSLASGVPELDVAAMNVEKGELVGYDFGFRVRQTVGTFIVFKRHSTSGVIINTGSTDWCSSAGMGGSSGEKIKKITSNAIDKLLNNENVFSF